MTTSPTILGRPSSSRKPSASQRRPELGGTLSPEPPLHVAAGSVEVDMDIRCDCSWGCWECDETTEWRRP